MVTIILKTYVKQIEGYGFERGRSLWVLATHHSPVVADALNCALA